MSDPILVPATLLPGFHPDEIHAIVGPNHSAFVHVTQVRAARLPLHSDDQVSGYVMAFVVERGETKTLVELPGVAIGGLRGFVPNLDIEPW